MRRVIVLAAVVAVAGCTERPPRSATEEQASPVTMGVTDAGTPSIDGKAAADASVTRGFELVPPAGPRRVSATGIRLPRAIVTISTRAPAEVLDGALAAADGVKPGLSVVARMALFGGLGLPADVLTKIGAGKPTRVFVFGEAANQGRFAAVVGQADGGGVRTLVDTIAQKTDMTASLEEGVYSFRGDASPLFVGHDAAWIVISDNVSTRQTLMEDILDGEPTPPDGDDHVEVDVDVAEIRRSYGDSIAGSIAQMREEIARNAQGDQEVVARALEEYFQVFTGLLDATERVEVSYAFGAEAVDCRITVTPVAGSALDTLAREQLPCRFQAAKALPADALATAALQLSPGPAQRLADALASATVRIAMGPHADPQVTEAIRAAMGSFVQPGEIAGSVAFGTTVDALWSTTASTADVRAGYKAIIALGETWAAMLEGMGMKMEMKYEEKVRELDGQPVDRVTGTYRMQGAFAQEQQRIMEAVGLGNGQTVEIVGAPTGTLLATGTDPNAQLAAALGAIAAAKPDGGRAWPSASPGLRRMLETAPGGTWCAGEFRLCRYMALAFDLVKSLQPMAAGVFPPTEALKDGKKDPPIVGWIASENRAIVALMRVPTVAVGTMVEFFLAMQHSMQVPPPAGVRPVAPSDGGATEVF